MRWIYWLPAVFLMLPVTGLPQERFSFSDSAVLARLTYDVHARPTEA